MAKSSPRVEVRVVPEDALLVEGNAARRGAATSMSLQLSFAGTGPKAGGGMRRFEAVS
jgi:hypothetical protein